MIFVFERGVSLVPEPSELVELFKGDRGRGMQLADDPMLRMKVIDLPALGLQIACEEHRIRFEDLEAREPASSPLPAEAARILTRLTENRRTKFQGYGFNFEVFYQTQDIIPIGEQYTAVSQPLPFGDHLLDFGWQWSVARKDGKEVDAYFMKVTAPLEFALHHNAHFHASRVPAERELAVEFSNAYQETHRTARGLLLKK
jgi:hypothetical protein